MAAVYEGPWPRPGPASGRGGVAGEGEWRARESGGRGRVAGEGGGMDGGGMDGGKACCSVSHAVTAPLGRGGPEAEWYCLARRHKSRSRRRGEAQSWRGFPCSALTAEPMQPLPPPAGEASLAQVKNDRRFAARC